jgi:hypothetical protein
MAKSRTRKAYGIYLPDDTEQWFKTTFTNEGRAHWYAEVNGLNPDEYEVRLTDEVPAQAAQMQEAA